MIACEDPVSDNQITKLQFQNEELGSSRASVLTDPCPDLSLLWFINTCHHFEGTLFSYFNLSGINTFQWHLMLLANGPGLIVIAWADIDTENLSSKMRRLEISCLDEKKISETTVKHCFNIF